MSSNPPAWGEPPATNQPPAYQPPAYQPPAQQGGMVCPKCRGAMRTYERNGIHLEQCDSCRGIFLDFGELEALTQLEGRMAQTPPPAYVQGGGYGPGWGQRGHHAYRRNGFGRLFFSS